MGKSQSQRSEYYAIFKGRVKEPTIFSSWGHTHPRITGHKQYNPKGWKGYATLQEARNSMEKIGVTKPKEIIKSEEEDTAPVDGNGFYAVANGNKPDIYPFYRGEIGAEKEVDQVKGSCHKQFRTRAQAEDFIEEWKEAFAEIWSEKIREALDEGFRPRDIDAFRPHKMRQTIDSFLHKPVIPTDINGLTKETTELSLQEESKD